MKKLQFDGIVALFLASFGLTGASFAQAPNYYNNGLAGNSFPLPPSSSNGGQQFYLAGNQTPVGTSVPQAYVAQNQISNLPPAVNAVREHVHIPPGNYNVPAGAQNMQAPVANGYVDSQIAPQPYSSTVPASGMSSSPVYSNMMPVPAQPYVESYPQSVPYGGYPQQGNVVYGSSAGCSSCGTGPVMSSAPVYSSVPSYSPTYGQVASCGAPTAYPSLSIVSPNPWIFGANALLLTTADREHVRFASDSNLPVPSSLSTRDVRFDHAGGFELYGGRYFGCGKYAAIASYWSIFPETQMRQVDTSVGANLRTNLPFTTRGTANPAVYYGLELPTSNVYDRYDTSFSQRLRRDQDFQNFELNFFSFALGGAARAGVATGGGCGSGGCGSGGCGDCSSGSCGGGGGCLTGPTGACAPIYGARCSPLRFSMLGGFRWFRFDDDLEYASSFTDNVYGTTADDVYYRNNVTNDLFGFQLGGQAAYCTGRRISLLAGTKFGVFCNHTDYATYVGTTDTAATIMSNNSYYGQPYSYRGTSNDVALLGEGNLGLGICLCKGLTANVGYRILGVNGIATAPGQVPTDFGLTNDAYKVDRSGSLILHGLTVGGAYNW